MTPYRFHTEAEEELDDDNLTIFDLENIILAGEIIERRRDRKTREVRFVVRGISLEGIEAETPVHLTSIQSAIAARLISGWAFVLISNWGKPWI